jgi:hypothetical protein
LAETPLIVSRVIDPPNEVDVPAIVIAELESEALAIALIDMLPEEFREIVAPTPVRLATCQASPVLPTNI